MPFRLGLLGVWHPHAPGMVRQIAAHPGEFELVGCWDPNRELLEQRREQWSALQPSLCLFDSADALLDQRLDGVLVEGVVSENLGHARRGLERGLPVLCEKPAGANIAEAEATFALACRQGVHLQMAYLFRYMSAVEEMLRRAKRGDIGHVYEFRGRLPKDLPLYQEHVDTLGQYSGGIFFEMAGHAIDFMCSILGPPREIKSIVGHHHPTRADRFVDNGAALFGFERAVGIVEVPALEITPDQRRFEVYGTEGALIIPHLGSGHLANNAVQPLDVLGRDGKTWERLNLPAAVLQIRDLREFAAVVRGEKQPDYSAEHDLAVHRALIESSGMA
ncbi:MAG: Gfo/Idh/MocA family oxidoreductase [Pirellulales bacterium]